jgi:lipid-A-disaccharide synthase
MSASDAILLASGTAALEAMLVNRPMVVAYKVSPLTFWLAKKLVKVAHVSLPNLLSDEPLVPELLQDEATPQAIADELYLQLTNQDPELQDSFRAMHILLRQDASQKAADAVTKVMEQ